MKKTGNSFELSATDLVGYLNCHHLTALDRAVAEGALPKPKVWDPFLQILSERGAAHEQSYVEHLKKAGLDVVRIDGVEVTNAAIADTLAAMQRGVHGHPTAGPLFAFTAVLVAPPCWVTRGRNLTLIASRLKASSVALLLQT